MRQRRGRSRRRSRCGRQQQFRADAAASPACPQHFITSPDSHKCSGKEVRTVRACGKHQLAALASGDRRSFDMNSSRLSR